MILDEKIKINIVNSNKKYYKDLGYDVSLPNLEILTKDLPKHSKKKINVKCDTCGSEKELSFQNYYKITNGLKDKYYCSKCRNFKASKTMVERYGESSALKISKFKEKQQETLEKRYGIQHPSQSKDFQNIMKNNLKNKYGVENISQIKEVKGKKIVSLENSWIDRMSKNFPELNIVSGDYQNKLLLIKCKDHEYEISYDLLYNRKQLNIEYCTKCNPINNNSSEGERELVNFIKNNYDGNIQEKNRKIIYPYEIDVFLPDLKLGIEFNGLYWHSEENNNKEKDYHRIKTNLSNQKNITLIHIYEDSWNFKKEIVKSRLLNLLNQTPSKIYARKCEIIELDNREYKDFLEENHLQGVVYSKYKFGLVYDNQLVSVMSFGEKRKSMGENSEKNNFELLRFCNKKYTNVVGGANKLFKYFIRNYQPESITTFSDRSWGEGNFYEKLGFEYVSTTKPNYYYIVNGKRKHRFNFRKDVLVKEGFDKNKSEHNIMLERKIYRIYDSGNNKFVFKNNI